MNEWPQIHKDDILDKTSYIRFVCYFKNMMRRRGRGSYTTIIEQIVRDIE